MDLSLRSTNAPVIYEFSTNKKVVKQGESFVLSWNADAEKVDLYRNGALLQSIQSGQNSIEKKEFYDSNSDVMYQLVAYKGGVQIKSRPITLRSSDAVQGSDPDLESILLSASPWARFIAIIGIAVCAIIIFVSLLTAYNRPPYFEPGVMFVSILVALVIMIPMIFLLRFSNLLKYGLKGNGPSLLKAFRNLKSYFISLGILIMMYLIALIFILMSNVR